MEKGKATHSCILAWRIAWMEETGKLQFMVSVNTTEQLTHSHTHTHTHTHTPYVFASFSPPSRLLISGE